MVPAAMVAATRRMSDQSNRPPAAVPLTVDEAFPGRRSHFTVAWSSTPFECATRVDGIAVDAAPANQKRNPTPIRASPRTGWSRARYCMLTKNRDPSR